MKFSFLQRHKDIFQGISGNDDIKWTLDKALKSPEPLHILLVGPPGLGKTRFLKAIEKEYDDSYFALASAATGAGMINACFENPPRYLLIDEIEDLMRSPHFYHCCRMVFWWKLKYQRHVD